MEIVYAFIRNDLCFFSSGIVLPWRTMLDIKVEDMIYSQTYNVKPDMQLIELQMRKGGLPPLMLQTLLLGDGRLLFPFRDIHAFQDKP
jgi:hypothetical protein